MIGKITLVSPPDIFENQNPSILFVNITDKEQEEVSLWLSDYELKTDVNFYIYSGEPDTQWFLWAVNSSDFKYANLDNQNILTQVLSGYILTKPNFYYFSKDETIGAILSHINNNRIKNITTFLERAFSGQTRTS